MTVQHWITSVKQSLVLLGQAESAQLDQMSIPDLVVFGQRLWWVVKRANKVLDAIKVRFRDEAAKVPSDAPARFDAPDGSHCLVIPHKASLSMRSDADIQHLKQALGDRFGDYFEEVISYKLRKDFSTRIASCVGPERVALNDAVDQVDRTSRVIFKD
jgi:hypothetical protein